MTDVEHFTILEEGVEVWNKWRKSNPEVEPDLIGANLGGANLSGVNLFYAVVRRANLREANLIGADLVQAEFTQADLSGANLSNAKLWAADFIQADLSGANLSGANLSEADLSGANLSKAKLRQANLIRTNLSGANLSGADLGSAYIGGANFSRANLCEASLSMSTLIHADLSQADLSGANLWQACLREANLSGANLSGATLETAMIIQTDVTNAKFDSCHVYGISVWDLKGTPKSQLNLVITPPEKPAITVDDLEVAQFIYLLIEREKLRNVIDTITSKAVLILGRFTHERKAVLDVLVDELRKHNLLPIIFDFERASSRDFTETIKTLAGMSLFVIADITNPKSSPLELQATVPDYQIPFIPIIQDDEEPFSMFKDLGKYPWVLPTLTYPSVSLLLMVFKEAILDRAFKKHKELQRMKAEGLRTVSVEDFLKKHAEQQ